MMKLTLLFITIIFTSATASAQTRAAEIANPTAFEVIPVQHMITDCIGKSVRDCGREVMMQLDLVGFGGEDNFIEKEESFTYRSGVSVYLFSMLGTKPSFTNEWRTRVAFTKTRNGLRFVQAGTQYRCLVNGKRGKWTKTPCESQRDGETEQFDLNRPTAMKEITSVENFRFINVTGRAAFILAEPCLDSLKACGEKLLNAIYRPSGFDTTRPEDRKDETFDFSIDGTQYGVFLATAVGYKDDSVAGERVRVEFRRNGNAWEVQNGSKEFLCARGENAWQWSKERCP